MKKQDLSLNIKWKWLFKFECVVYLQMYATKKDLKEGCKLKLYIFDLSKKDNHVYVIINTIFCLF